VVGGRITISADQSSGGSLKEPLSGTTVHFTSRGRRGLPAVATPLESIFASEITKSTLSKLSYKNCWKGGKVASKLKNNSELGLVVLKTLLKETSEHSVSRFSFNLI